MHENKRKTVCRIKKYLIVDLSFIRIFKGHQKNCSQWRRLHSHVRWAFFWWRWKLTLHTFGFRTLSHTEITDYKPVYWGLLRNTLSKRLLPIVPRSFHSARPMRFGSRGPSELSAVGLGYVTEMASEDAVQGLAKQAQRSGEGGPKSQ